MTRTNFVPMNDSYQPSPSTEDALILVDVQNDFLPGGALAVPDGEKIITPLNCYIKIFTDSLLPIYQTRDWHPKRHCSFHAQGGPWPSHCVQGSYGAQFCKALNTPRYSQIVSKGTAENEEAYSGFEHTDLSERLQLHNIHRLWIGGLATDYCILNTVLDALKHGFSVLLLEDAIRAVNVHQGDEQRALEKMRGGGAEFIRGEQYNAQKQYTVD